MTAAVAANVSRVILASFPHVEGPSSVERPATGRLDREPVSVHARTDSKKSGCCSRGTHSSTTPVVLRLGTIYGRGILMVERPAGSRSAGCSAAGRNRRCSICVDGRFPAGDRGGDARPACEASIMSATSAPFRCRSSSTPRAACGAARGQRESRIRSCRGGVPVREGRWCPHAVAADA